MNELFDLIVGISTGKYPLRPVSMKNVVEVIRRGADALLGGIIALGLATRRMSPEQMRDKFLIFASKAFKYRREGPLITALDPLRITSFTLLVLRLTNSIYPTTPLRESLQDLFGETENIFSPARRTVRVAVTSCKEKATTFCFITNYNRPTLSNEQDFEREDDNAKEMKIWEAGMATSAAPFYFRPFEMESVKKDYVDGALEANFPVPVALDEVARIWQGPDGNKAQLDILVTVGAGIQVKERSSLPTVLRIGGAEEVWYNFHNNMNSEKNWCRFHQTHVKDSELDGRVYRLNVRLEPPYVMLDDHRKMHQIYECLKRPSKLLPLYLSVAEALIANLFFFKPNVTQKERYTAGRKTLVGTIRCPLARDSPALKELVMRIDGFWHRELHTATTSFWVRNEQLWTPIELSNYELNQVRTNKKWLRIAHTIVSSAEAGEVQHVIAVRLRRRRLLDQQSAQLPDISDLIPISGFPASFNSLQKKAKGR
jgi:predicted acylesterase/phospholipase RssA